MGHLTKLDNLTSWFGDKDAVMVALSGGVDSALVAYAAFAKLGDSAVAVTANYKTLSREELDASRQVCSEIGIRQMFLNYDELEDEEFARNGPDRCFHCRQQLGGRLSELAERHGIRVIVDGTNTGDLGDYRPGIDAMRQSGVRSPLLETGFSKPEIRDAARSVGLSIHDRPSNSCLASRIPWGQRVTAERLARIEFGETIVKQLTNLEQVRVRDLDGSAKIEVEKDMIPRLDGVLEQLAERLGAIGFSRVEVDQEGYKPGKINVITD